MKTKQRLSFGVGLAIAFALASILAAPAVANEAIAKAEGGMTCTVCHDKPGSKLLTDKGKFYESTRSLEGYQEVLAAFRSCTTCHVRKPGSKKLTQQGKAFARGVGGMTALREWALSAHPSSQEKTEGTREEAPPPKLMPAH